MTPLKLVLGDDPVTGRCVELALRSAEISDDVLLDEVIDRAKPTLDAAARAAFTESLIVVDV